ncbi:MAG: ABC transporter permease [Spirochaetales bacterium]|nr:ABC transporter permease [Spirochaetales bacterium]
MLKDIFVTLSIEITKIRKTMIFWISIAASCFMSFILGLMMWLVMNPDLLPPGILKTKVDLAAINADWPSYIGFVEMAVAALGIVLFGFAVSWIFGREYHDRTVKDLLALPVSRTAIVISKLIAVSLWCLLLNAIVFVLSLVTGALLQLPLWSAGLFPGYLTVFAVTTLLCLLLCPPVAFVASAGKGYLPSIGFVVLCMGLANLFGNIGLGSFFPWTVPMIYAGAIGGVTNQLPIESIIAMGITFIAGTVGTVYYWKYADQCR